jgi:hypothetical protein
MRPAKMRPAQMCNSMLRLNSERKRGLGFEPRSEEGRRIRCEEANEASERTEKRGAGEQGSQERRGAGEEGRGEQREKGMRRNLELSRERGIFVLTLR